MSGQNTSQTSLSWEALTKLTSNEIDYINGPNNSYSCLRLFNQKESSIRVTLYRDHHAWCPYCQKVWLWLEFKKIPYRIKKVTMRCYGKKEKWYLQKVPTGMLPAIELDKRLITESDEILLALEDSFGPLGTPINNIQNKKLRLLERKLFRAWCIWLCSPNLNSYQEEICRDQFQTLAKEMEANLQASNGSWLDSNLSMHSKPGSIDIIFIPYVERMNASLAYYKGFSLREKHPLINIWLSHLETLNEYRGSQGDFHTHAHDLPPQMGGCWVHANKKQEQFLTAIDIGHGLENLEICLPSRQTQERSKPELIALERVIKHRKNILKVNPLGPKLFDQPLRAALSKMVLGKSFHPNKGSAIGLRYLRDRISIPRDMPLLSGRRLRQALEATAQLDSNKQSRTISTTNRYDQDPANFGR